MPFISDETDEAYEIPKSSFSWTDILTTPILTAAHILDTPGSIVRGLLAGKELTDVMQGIYDIDKRASGRDVLKNFGVGKETGKWGSFDVGSLLAEIFTDPLLPVSSVFGLTKIGRASKALVEAEKTAELTRNILKTTAATARAEGITSPLREIAPDIFRTYTQAKRAISAAKEAGTTRLGATIPEQIKLGQKGLELSALGFGPSIPLPKISEALDTLGIIRGANKGWDYVAKGASFLTKPFKSAFSTAKETPMGQFISDATDRAITENELIYQRTKKEWDQVLDKMANDAGLSREEVNKLMTKGVEFTGAPQRINATFEALIQNESTRMQADMVKAGHTFDVRFQEMQRPLHELVAAQPFYYGERIQNPTLPGWVGTKVKATDVAKDPVASFLKKNDRAAYERLLSGDLTKDEYFLAHARMQEATIVDPDAYSAFAEKFKADYGVELTKPLAEHISDYNTQIAKLKKNFDAQLKRIRTRTLNRITNLRHEQYIRLDSASRAEGLIGHQGGTPDEFQKIVDEVLGKISGQFKQSFNLEKSSGKLIKELQDWYTNYYPRIATPRGNVFLHSNLEADSLFREILAARTPNARLRKFEHMSIEELNDMFRGKFKLDFDVFSEDPAYVIAERQRRTNNAISVARLVNAAIQTNATSEATEGAVHIVDLIFSAKLQGFVPAGSDKLITWGLNTKPALAKEIVAKAGIEDVWIPKELANDLMTHSSAYTVGDLENVFRIFDPINTMYRATLTSVPAHVGTNFVGNLWSNMLVGLLPFTPKGLRTYTSAMNLFVRDYLEKNPDSWVKQLFKHSEPLSDAERQLIDNYTIFAGGNRNRISEINMLIAQEKKGPMTKFFMGEQANVGSKFFAGSKEFNNFVEESAKLAHFMHQIDQGMSLIDAGKSVKKYLFDYTDLTDFEKKVMRRAVLFYTFSRKNLPLAISETLLNRRAYAMAKIPLATTRSEDFVPDYILSQGNVGLGQGTYIDTKNPLFEANKFGTQGGGLQRFFDQVAQQLVPHFKVPLELISGREFFRGAPLEAVNKLPNRYFGVIPSEWIPTVQELETTRGTEHRGAGWVTEALRNAPWTRYQQIAQDIADEEIKPLPSILGLRARQIDPEKLKLQKTVKNIKQILANDPSVREFNRFFSIEQEPNEQVKGYIKQLEAANKKLYPKL